MDFVFSDHALKRMERRGVLVEWVEQAIRLGHRNRVELEETHYIKRIFENANLELEVVVNPIDKIIITLWWNE